jgi:hypothetical protein
MSLSVSRTFPVNHTTLALPHLVFQTQDACDTMTGTCKYTNLTGGNCDDGNSCTEYVSLARGAPPAQRRAAAGCHPIHA